MTRSYSFCVIFLSTYGLRVSDSSDNDSAKYVASIHLVVVELQYTQCIIKYTVNTIHYTAGVANLWPAGQKWPFSKNEWPILNPEEQKKVTKKNLGRLEKKYQFMALSKRRSLIFPFFGPPTTIGWRPLLYTIHYTVYNIHCSIHYILQ